MKNIDNCRQIAPVPGTPIVLGGNAEFVAGMPAVVEIEKQLADYARSSSPADDVLVFLEPENIPVLAVRVRAGSIVLQQEQDGEGKRREILVTAGTAFRISVASRFKKSTARLVTKFIY